MLWIRGCSHAVACLLALSCVTGLFAIEQVAPVTAIPPKIQPQIARPLRLAILGASASAGVGCFAVETREDGRYGAAVDLKRCVKSACTEQECIVTDLASSMFFTAPVKRGEGQMTRALKSNPDGIIAVDYLFWYAYGYDGPTGDFLASEAERIAKFELGLTQLERCACPVVIGDLPDMSAAVGKMLSVSQMPQLETIKKLNARLYEWAKSRPNVCVIPLGALSEDLRVKHAIRIADMEWAATTAEPLLQDDALHPTARGLAGITAVALLAIDPLLAAEFRAKCPHDPKLIFEALTKSLPKLSESREQKEAIAPKNAA